MCDRFSVIARRTIRAIGKPWWGGRSTASLSIAALLIAASPLPGSERVPWLPAPAGMAGPGLKASGATVALARQRPSRDCTRTSIGRTPLTDGPGLYHTGENTPPHLDTLLASASEITPRLADGAPDPAGVIVLMSVGMSNTFEEFGRFEQMAGLDPAISPHVRLVNAARGGVDITRMVDSGNSYWRNAEMLLARQGFTPQQVQAIWLKEAKKDPTGPWPAHAEELTNGLVTVVSRVQSHFPNLKIIYVSSRIYGGYALGSLNPEPYAYESGWSYRWLIERQVNGDPSLRGVAPIMWGPYLWADGENPRSDGLTWLCRDTAKDGTHPLESGQRKVATLLLDFFKTDPTACRWFLAAGC